MQSKLIRVSTVVASLLLCAAAHGQPAAVQQLQINQVSRMTQPATAGLVPGTNAPVMYQGENEDVGPQRILRLNPRRTYFDLLFDSQVFYSDNANYAPKPFDVGSAVYVNTVQAAFAPSAVDLGPGKAAAAIGVIGQWYNYGDDRIRSLDFNADTVFLGGKYTLDKWQFGLGVNLTILLNQDGYDETYRECMPNFGVQRILPINDKLFFSLGELVDYHFTEVPTLFGSRGDVNNRFDSITSVTFNWQATKHLIIQPYYRFQYTYYQEIPAGSGHDNYLQSVGLTAVYYFNQKISVRAFYNYNRKHSNDLFTPGYLEMNGGIGATLDIRF